MDRVDPFASYAETYDWTETWTTDVPFWVELARQTEGPILELGAGTGRVTLPIAKLGKHVTALDVSLAMLSRLREKWESCGKPGQIERVLGNLYRFSLREHYPLILAPARVFEHPLTEGDRHSAFESVAENLTPGGRFALYVWGEPWDTDQVVEKQVDIEAAEDHGDLKFTWRERRDFDAGIRTHIFRVEELNGARRRWEHEPIRLRWYTHRDLTRLGEATGLRVEARYGDFARSRYIDGNLHMIWIFAKPTER